MVAILHGTLYFKYISVEFLYKRILIESFLFFYCSLWSLEFGKMLVNTSEPQSYIWINYNSCFLDADSYAYICINLRTIPSWHACSSTMLLYCSEILVSQPYSFSWLYCKHSSSFLAPIYIFFPLPIELFNNCFWLSRKIFFNMKLVFLL